MCARAQIVRDVVRQHAVKALCVHHDHVIEAVASDRAMTRSAELSPRTFCSFRRELSSLRRDGLTSADARKCPRGVERRNRTLDDHAHDDPRGVFSSATTTGFGSLSKARGT